MPTGTAPVTSTTTGTRPGAMRWPVMTSTALVGREMADLMAEHGRLLGDVQRLRKVRDDLAATGRKRAEAADADELGHAMRSGGKDPGATHLRQHEQAMQDAERQVAGAQRALSLVEADVKAQLDERGAAYLADLQTLLDEARRRVADAVAAVHEAVNDEQSLRAIGLWLASGKPGQASARQVPGLTKGLHGDTYSLPQVLAALGDAVR